MAKQASGTIKCECGNVFQERTDYLKQRCRECGTVHVTGLGRQIQSLEEPNYAYQFQAET